MGAIVRILGGAEAARIALATRLRAGAFDLEQPAEYPANVLVVLEQTAECAIASATDFALAHPAEAGDRLVINIWRVPVGMDWNSNRHAAIMAAFTRHAALAWASSRVRVNALTIPADADRNGLAEDDIAAAILGLWRWRSMTGQTIHLGA